jgi:aminoglycoside 6'-N-acetyltransferase
MLDDLPTLRGRAVVLRPAGLGEIADISARLAADEGARIWWHHDPATMERWLNEPDGTLLVEMDGAVVGVVDFFEENDPDGRSAGMDIALLGCCTGRGVGGDALRTLCRYLVDVRGHHRLTIDPALANERAIRAYEKVGFKRIGVAREYERGPDGTYHDNLLMDLLARELEPWP